MDRRNFLKTGGIALLGSLATGSAMALTTPGALGGEGADKKAAVALAMNHFGVSEADLKKVLAAALEKGGDYADLFFEHTITNSIRLMDASAKIIHLPRAWESPMFRAYPAPFPSLVNRTSVFFLPFPGK